MDNNEDYLDSLLKQMEQSESSDSALNRVREISKSADSAADIVNVDSTAGNDDIDNSESAVNTEDLSNIAPTEQPLDDILSSLTGLDFSANDTNLDEPSIGASVNDESVLDNFDLDKLLDEVTSEEDSFLEESFSESASVLDDIVSVIESVSEETVSEPATFFEETVSEETVSESATISEENISEIESSSEDIASENETALDEAILNEETVVISDGETKEEIAEDLLDDLSVEDSSSNEVSIDMDSSNEQVDLEDLLEEMSKEESNEESETEKSENSELDFSASEIDSMLEKAAEQEGELEIDLADLESLENEFGIRDKGDSTVTDDSSNEDEISSLLSDLEKEASEEANSDDDMLNLFNDAVSQSMEADRIAEELNKEKDKDEQLTKEEKKKKKKKKDKKNASDDESSVDSELLENEKKKGFFAKLLDYLTASDEDDEESLIKATDIPTEGSEAASGENKEILEQIDNEEDKKGKKKKKKKDKKGKKGKEEASPEGEEGDEEVEVKKSKKPKKEKKERKPLTLDIDTGKPLSKRNVILIFALCFSILIGILLILKFVPSSIQKTQAREAFYKGDYEKTYTTFFGEKLSESDQVLFNRAEILLKVRHKYDAYVAYKNLNMPVEALDQLLQAVNSHEMWSNVAEINGVSQSFESEYQNILVALTLDFNLSEADAKDIIMLPTDLEYSLMCEAVAYGTEYIDPNEPLPGPFVPPVEEGDMVIILEDILPEETY